MTRGGELSDWALYRRLLLEARPYWPHIAGLFALGLFSTPLALLTPVPLKVVVDSVLGDHPLPGFLDAILPPVATGSDTALLSVAVLLILIISASNQLLALGSSVLDTYTGEKLVLAFRSRLFGHVQRLSLKYHVDRGSYDSTFRILYDAPTIQWIAIHGVLPLVTAGFMLIGMLYVTARIDWQLALIALAVSPVLLTVTLAWRPRLRAQWRQAKQRESSAVSVLQETLGAVQLVKSFGQEEREMHRFRQRAWRGVQARVKATLNENLFGFQIGLILAVGSATVLLVGSLHVMQGRLTLGSLILVMTYIGQLYSPLKTLGGTVATLQSSLAGAERALTILDQTPEVVQREDARPVARARGEFLFDRVSFSYGNDAPVLRDVSLEIPAGTHVGIAGPSGAGKTTLVSLLPRFYDPTSGRILMDGVDLRDYRLEDLRSQFSIVLQEPILFSTTIAENIAYARLEATETEIEEAARAANAHSFILGLPQGYETLVGERGMRLSGGERQRISLARAFLRNAPVLILDEPTSSVDVETEALILASMRQLTRDRTCFTITHRATTIRNVDLLLVIEDTRLTCHEASPRRVS